ncbi:NAD(P)-binding domain-containing protein [Iodobacter sp. LRB]|uniref:NADPH-dependent F420 reductase n=1 Tax=Iodobacter sp. LRB TaxID=3127955 RepID=UPI00307E2416
MNIGIIGAGFVGRTVGKLAVKAGHQVMISNSRGPKSMYSLPYAIGCTLGTVQEAVDFADIVLLAIPLYAYRDLPALLVAGKLVVDACNYYPDRDGHIPELDKQEITSSALLALHFNQSRIVKAFNAITMNDLDADGLPPVSPNRRALPIAGDKEEDKALIGRLYEQFGFDVVDAGRLAAGRNFEPGTPSYCKRLPRNELASVLAEG